MPTQLLEGIRVIDFTWAFVGPQTTKTLADCGAEVIKIESATRPGFWRTTGPFKDNEPGLDSSIPFAMFNTNKLSATLNLTYPKALEIVKKLIATADIVIDNFAGGTMDRMGLGYEVLKKTKPDIIMLSACMHGQTGPYATHPGFGNQLTALCGFSHISGWPDREPVDLGAYTDLVAPQFNVLAIGAALDYRRRTGKGQFLDMAEYESGLHFMGPILLDYIANQRVANRMGNLCPYAAPHNMYPCRGNEEWCAIVVSTDEQWKNLCDVMGNPSWTSDIRFTTLTARKENEEELDRLLGEWTINHSPDEVMSKLQAAGVPAGARRTGIDIQLNKEPQLVDRQYFSELDHEVIGTHKVRRPPYILSKVPFDMRPAPLIGEHSEYVFKDILGMSDEELEELVIEGVIE
ncbi:MAG: CoA transferase [Desulfobacterales bacterium]